MNWHSQIAVHCVDLVVGLWIILQQARLARELEPLKSLARKHAPDAVKELARLALEAENERDKLMAISQLLDRACSK